MAVIRVLVLEDDEAVRQLTRLINGEQAEALTLMRTKLVIRESCGCLFSDTNGQEESTRR